MCSEIAEVFSRAPKTKVRCSRLETLEEDIDSIVTAGNSYGLMSAGFDAAVVHVLGDKIEDRVREHIACEFFGEQPVGSAFVLKTEHAKYKTLVHAPTMRTPGPIDHTDHVYTSTWASLLAIAKHNRSDADSIEHALFPLMGTGFGRVSHREAARQMTAAIRHFRYPQRINDWNLVVARERSITHKISLEN